MIDFFLYFSASVVKVQQLKQFMTNQMESIRSFNLFKSNCDAAGDLRKQRLHTRIYLILLISSLAVTFMYSLLIERTKTVTVQYPTLIEYTRLIELNPEKVDCPCTRVSIPYHEFVKELKVTSYHPACRTSVIHNVLLFGTASDEDSTFIDGSNFETWKRLFSDGLEQLCQIAASTVQDRIEVFRLSSMYAYRMVPLDLFKEKIDSTLNSFEKEIFSTFQQTLDLIRASSQDNALIAMYSANWKFTLSDSYLGERTSFRTEPVTHKSLDSNTSCSCANQRSCSKPSILSAWNGSSYNSPEGIVFSCFLLETVLLSSLSCFYSIPCVNQYRSLLQFSFGTIEYWASLGV
jgi:hypothetical protein